MGNPLNLVSSYHCRYIKFRNSNHDDKVLNVGFGIYPRFNHRPRSNAQRGFKRRVTRRLCTPFEYNYYSVGLSPFGLLKADVRTLQASDRGAIHSNFECRSDFICLSGRFLLISNEFQSDFEKLQKIFSDFGRSKLISRVFIRFRSDFLV